MTTSTDTTIERLTEGQCWELLCSNESGRLAVRLGDGVDIFPINYLIKDQTIYFSSAPGSKMVELTANPQVALEIDGILDRQRWSVVVKGAAERLSTSTEIEWSGISGLHTQEPNDKWNYVRVQPSEVTGRRFTSRRKTSVPTAIDTAMGIDPE